MNLLGNALDIFYVNDIQNVICVYFHDKNNSNCSEY